MKNAKLWLYCGIIAQFAVTLSYSLTRLYTNKTSLIDIGVFWQMLCNFRDTGVPISTINYPYLATNFLGFHFSPILLLLTPLTYLPVYSLLVFQSFIIAISAIPLFAACNKILNNEKLALVWTIIFLFYPHILSGAVFDFHEQSLAVFFFSLAFYALVFVRFRLFIFCMFLLLLTKEHYGVAVAGFGIVWWKHNRDNRGIAVAVFGIAACYAVIFQIMPFYSGTMHPMLMSSTSSLSRYGWIMNHDWRFLHELLVSKEFGIPMYIMTVLILMIFMPLLAPLYLLPGAADFLANSLAAVSMPRSIYSYHSMTLIPVFVIAACIGISRIPKKWEKRAREYSYMILVIQFIMLAGMGPVPTGVYNLWQLDKYSFDKDPEIDKIKKLVGENSTVSAQNNIGVWFSDRAGVYPFPDVYKGADYVILDKNYPFKKSVDIFSDPYIPSVYAESSKLLSHDPDYSVVYNRNNWLVYRRNR